MDNRNTVLEITPKNEIIRVHHGRQQVIARLDKDNKVLTWKDADTQAAFRVSMESFLTEERVHIETVLMEGQKADVVPETAPPPPKQHKMQGELTPDYLEWLEKWKPIAFQNLMGVVLRELKPGEQPPTNPRDLWLRAKVKRSDTRPNPAAQGGQYITTKFTMEDQIIARRASHLTFTPKEIFRGDSPEEQAEPFKDPHHPENLHRMAQRGTNGTEIVEVKEAAASAGSKF